MGAHENQSPDEDIRSPCGEITLEMIEKTFSHEKGHKIEIDCLSIGEPAVDLWRAVVVRAWLDAFFTATECSGFYKSGKQEAISFITGATPYWRLGLQQACSNAALDWRMIMEMGRFYKEHKLDKPKDCSYADKRRRSGRV